jgi:GTP-binding protein YchF
MSSLSIAIVGLPNVGKSTLFNCLTDAGVLAANYPFATIEPNTGIVPVPDNRLEVLAAIYKTSQVIPATVKFVDVAGLVAGASKGEGLGNQFLAHIRQCDAIVHVVRSFADPDVQTVTNNPDPAADIDIINTELTLADIQTIENHLPKIQKEAKSHPPARRLVDFLMSVQNQLLSGRLPSQPTDRDEQSLLAKLQLLTLKPMILVFNVDEDGLTNQSQQDKLRLIVRQAESSGDDSAETADNVIFVAAKLENDLRSLSAIEAAELLADYGVTDSGLTKLVKTAYPVLGLQSFLTAGEKEVRAWTIHAGWTAPQAAGVIHTDFERGFIAAEVVAYPDLVAAGSAIAARKAGKIRTEGRNYIMQPDDVVEFRFNV